MDDNPYELEELLQSLLELEETMLDEINRMRSLIESMVVNLEEYDED